PATQPADFKININWGDGEESVGDKYLAGISGIYGNFVIKGTHVYHEQNGIGIPILVTVTGPDGTNQTAQLNRAYVMPMPSGIPGIEPKKYAGDAPAELVEVSHPSGGGTLNAYAGVNVQNADLGPVWASHFGMPDMDVSHLHAQINWGDSDQWTEGDLT